VRRSTALPAARRKTQPAPTRQKDGQVLPDVCERCGELGCEPCGEPPRDGATEAATACRDYARDVLGVERLIAIIDPRNRPSQRVAGKLGLVVERESDDHGRWRIYAASLRPR
jgi:hypothetical protein